MSIHKTLAAVAAVTVSMTAGAANAATYDVSRQYETQLFSFSDPVMTSMSLNGNTVTAQIGGYAVSAEDVDTGETWDFVGWCIDLFTTLNHGGYASTSVDTYVSSPDEPAGLASAERFDNLESFFNRAYDPSILSDPILAGGFQLAIWEILYETSGTYALSGADAGAFQGVEHTDTVTNRYGVVRSSTLETEQDAWDAADTFLATWLNWTDGDAETPWNFTYFAAEDGVRTNQSLVTVTPPSEVPLPAPALLLIGGIAALGAMKRRKA